MKEAGRRFTYFLGGTDEPDPPGTRSPLGMGMGMGPADRGASWGVPSPTRQSQPGPTGGLTFSVQGGGVPKLSSEIKPEEPPPDDWDFARIPDGDGPLSFDLRVSYASSFLPLVAALVLGVLSLLVLGYLRLRGGTPALVALVALATAMLPLDLYFPREASLATGCLLAGLLAVTLYRVILDGIELWEKTRRELEKRRLKALSKSGSVTRSAGGRDTGGGLYSGPNLQKNECTYEDVFRDDEGITFIMGES
jgi:hypothetical protein